jgi:hypothetical protein
MMNEFRRISSRTVCRLSLFGVVAAIALCGAASAQTATTAFGRQMEKVDLGISGLGQLNPSSSGTNYINQTVAQVPSNTLGVLIEIRYTKSPLVGIEFNYSYARYNETFNVGSGSLPAQQPYQLGVQSKVNEYSMGYVAHGPTFAGLKTFGGVGLGAVEFKPTSGGGQGLPPEVRTGFYYTVGVEQGFNQDRFGVRAYFRQLFLGAPDFNENYLATGARTITTEPGVGFYLRF